MSIAHVAGAGFKRTDKSKMLALSGLQNGLAWTKKLRDVARERLWATGDYQNVIIRVHEYEKVPNDLEVEIYVLERIR